MKKNLLKAVFVAAFAMIAGYGVYTTQAQVNLTDITLENVEALAAGESSSDCSTYCSTDPRATCIIMYSNGEGVTCYDHRGK